MFDEIEALKVALEDANTALNTAIQNVADAKADLDATHNADPRGTGTHMLPTSEDL